MCVSIDGCFGHEHRHYGQISPRKTDGGFSCRPTDSGCLGSVDQWWSQQAMVYLQRPPTRGCRERTVNQEFTGELWTFPIDLRNIKWTVLLQLLLPQELLPTQTLAAVCCKSWCSSSPLTRKREKKMFPLCFCDTFLYGNIGDAVKWERESFSATFRRFAEIPAFPFDSFYFAIWVFCTLPRVIKLHVKVHDRQINMAVSPYRRTHWLFMFADFNIMSL